jgi:hypothetical protein
MQVCWLTAWVAVPVRLDFSLSGADLTGRIFPSGCVFILLLLWGKQGNKSYFSLMFDNFEANNW